MALLRYPDVFRAASASSPVTDWRDYDAIYTVRYMGNRRKISPAAMPARS
jgi:dipeptidyl-peptidase-4